MKKLLCTFLAISIAVVTFAQPWKKVEGNGNVIKETRTIEAFRAISSGGSFDVQLVYGESNKLVVEADDNLMPYIKTKVENGKLSVGTEGNVNLNYKTKIKITAHATTINEIALAGSGSINGEGNFGVDNNLSVKLAGSGSVRFAFKDANTVNVAIAGSGNSNLKGEAKEVEIKISGSGDANCENVNCKSAVAKISGSGNAKVAASSSVDAVISGSGTVYYTGAATNINKKISGSGRVVKM